MNNGISVFKKIDEFVFAQIENFKASTSYQQLMDLTAGLDDEAQRKANYAISIAIVLLPILIIFFLIWQNVDVQKSLKTKRDIQVLTSEISTKIRRLKNVEANVIGPSIIASDGELQNALNGILKTFNVPSDKIKISDFDVTESSTNLKRVSASINYHDFSLNQLTGFLGVLIAKEKMIIPDFYIKRDATSELLTGKIKIYHHFRNE